MSLRSSPIIQPKMFALVFLGINSVPQLQTEVLMRPRFACGMAEHIQICDAKHILLIGSSWGMPRA